MLCISQKYISNCPKELFLHKITLCVLNNDDPVNFGEQIVMLLKPDINTMECLAIYSAPIYIHIKEHRCIINVTTEKNVKMSLKISFAHTTRGTLQPWMRPAAAVCRSCRARSHKMHIFACNIAPQVFQGVYPTLPFLENGTSPSCGAR